MYNQCLSAAILSDVMSSSLRHDLLLLDVTPHSIGVELSGGVMAALVRRNTTIPTKSFLLLTTCRDSQPSAIVQVCPVGFRQSMK